MSEMSEFSRQLQIININTDMRTGVFEINEKVNLPGVKELNLSMLASMVQLNDKKIPDLAEINSKKLISCLERTIAAESVEEAKRIIKFAIRDDDSDAMDVRLAFGIVVGDEEVRNFRVAETGNSTPSTPDRLSDMENEE